jgi:hypothetical protein
MSAALLIKSWLRRWILPKWRTRSLRHATLLERDHLDALVNPPVPTHSAGTFTPFVSDGVPQNQDWLSVDRVASSSFPSTIQVWAAAPQVRE